MSMRASNIRQLGLGIMVFLFVSLTACHRPGRLVDLAKVEDERTEEMIRAERSMKRGEELLDRGKASEAQEEFIAALKQYPAIAKAHENLATIYEAEGDDVSATAEYIAFTELASSSRMYLDRMLPYVQGKYSRNPAGPGDLSTQSKARAMVFLSKALDEHRQSKLVPAMKHLKSVSAFVPDFGLVDYVSGWWLLNSGDKSAAAASFVAAARKNAYFAMRLLQRLADPPAGLLEKLQQSLTVGLDQHPSDSVCALSLAAIDLRLEKYSDALKVVKNALSWGRPSWELLFLKAVAHKRLGQKVQTSQAIADLKDLHVDPSSDFSIWAKSIFGGLLGGSGQDVASGELAAALGQPASSYFTWRLFQEAGDTQKAKTAYDLFVAFLDAQYPKGQFENIPGSKPVDHSPATIREFRGAVQASLSEVMPALWQCDVSRRTKRANPSGRLTVRIELNRQGHGEQIGIIDNSTNDPVMAYCVVRKLLEVRFPKPVLGTERFQHTIIFGPEVDDLLNKALEN